MVGQLPLSWNRVGGYHRGWIFNIIYNIVDGYHLGWISSWMDIIASDIKLSSLKDLASGNMNHERLKKSVI